LSGAEVRSLRTAQGVPPHTVCRLLSLTLCRPLPTGPAIRLPPAATFLLPFRLAHRQEDLSRRFRRNFLRAGRNLSLPALDSYRQEMGLQGSAARATKRQPSPRRKAQCWFGPLHAGWRRHWLLTTALFTHGWRINCRVCIRPEHRKISNSTTASRRDGRAAYIHDNLCATRE